MAKEIENQVLREYGNRKKRYKRIRNIIVFTLLLAVVLVAVIYTVYINNRSYKSYKIVKSTEIVADTATNYLELDSAVIKYGKDGAAAYDQSGKQLWNSSFDMSDPITDICGKYVAIADRGGTSVHIFNDKGETGKYSTDYNITKIEVSSGGVVAALMEEGKDNHIMIYDQDGTPLLNFSRSVNLIGYPLDMTISNDGQKLVLCCLTVSNGDLICKVGCYNFDKVGKNYTDRSVGGFPFDKGIIVPKVTFLNNDTFVVYKDNGFKIYSMKELPSDVKDIKLKGTIQSILYNSNYTGVVLQAADGAGKHLMLYNLKGKMILDKVIDFDYKKIFLTDKEIIMHNDMNSIIMKLNGKIKFKDTFKTVIEGLYPINNLDQYFLISDNKLSDIQLKD